MYGQTVYNQTAYGYPPSSPLATPLHHGQQPMVPQPTGVPISQQSNAVFQPASPAHLLQQHQPMSPTHLLQQQQTISPAHLLQQQQPMSPAHLLQQQQQQSDITVEDIEDERSALKRKPRKDGRRSSSLSDTPSLSQATPLYGSPSWWGEEEGSSEGELDSIYGGSKILRDLTRSRTPPPPRTTATDELRKQAISNSQSSRAQEHESPSSWTVQFSAPTSKQLPSRLVRRPRSADPSPTRVRRSVSPVRRSASPGVAPQRRSLASERIKKETPSQRLPSAKKPPSGSKLTPRRSAPAPALARPKQSLHKPTMVKHQEPPTGTDHNLTYTTHPGSDESHSSVSDLSTASVSDRHPVSSSPVQTLKSQSASHIANETMTLQEQDPHDGDRPSSARKQWTNEQPKVIFNGSEHVANSVLLHCSNGTSVHTHTHTHTHTQPPDSLMLASIEARMRRLGKMAQTTAQAVSSLRQGATLGVADPPSSPVTTLTEQDLPEWKFFNKVWLT